MSKQENTKGNTQNTKNGKDFDNAKQYKRNPKDGKQSKTSNCIANGIGRENDPSWYNNSSALVRDAASISFYTPAGAGYIPDSAASDAVDLTAIPGIMVLKTVTGPGISKDPTSAVNLAAQRMYVNMRKNNSGASNYASADMMMYCLALDSAYICYAEMVRLYGLLNCWDQLNRYAPRYIIQALGYDFDDFKNNMADFRMYVQTWIRQINAFALPVSFTISKRHAWLFSNIWKDSSNAKAQLYMHSPSGYYTWEDQTSDQGTMLQFHDWEAIHTSGEGKGILLGELQVAMDEVAQKLANSTDVAIIAGDLEKAYGSNNMFTLAELDPEYTVEPVFSEEVLMQIENTTPLTKECRPTDMSSWNITQDVDRNMITYAPVFKTIVNGSTEDGYIASLLDAYFRIDSQPLNVHMADPTPDDVMVATRGRIRLNAKKAGDNLVYGLQSVGCDFVESMTMYTLTPSLKTLNPIRFLPLIFDTPAGALKVSDFIYASACASMFDWHPLITFIGNSGDLINYIWDFDNYTKLHHSTLQKINDAAIYNLWDIPTLPAKG